MIELAAGKGAVLTEDITRIIPHQSRADWSVIYTYSDPQGLEIRGSAEELCITWITYMELLYEELDLDDGDDDDELYDSAEDMSGESGASDDQADD